MQEFEKKILGSVNPTTYGLGFRCPSDLTQQTVTLIISSNEMEDIMQIVNSLEDYCLLVKGISQTIENETK